MGGFNKIVTPPPPAGGLIPPVLSGSATFLSTDYAMDLVVENADPAFPAAVEFFFPNSALKATTYDGGTDDLPTYGFAPAAIEDLTFVRGAGALPVLETITGVLPDGTTVTHNVTVQALPPEFYNSLTNIAPPTFEFRMDAVDGSGLMVNTGSKGATYNAALTGCVPTVQAIDPFTGYVEMDAGGDHTEAPFGSYPLAADLLRNADRSYVMVWDVVVDTGSGQYLTLCTALTTNNGWGWMYQPTASGILQSRYLFSSSSDELSFANPRSKNDNGPVEDCLMTAVAAGPPIQPRRTILCVTYDQTTKNTFLRWKQTGHGAGHSYIEDYSAEDTAAGAAVVVWQGWASTAAYKVQWRYLAVVDTVLSSTEFEVLASNAGLNSVPTI